jgi:hypothetical protein
MPAGECTTAGLPPATAYYGGEAGQVDLIVGIPKSKEGFTAIAVSKDIHTGYLWLHPLTTRCPTEVAEALMKVMRQFVPI